MMVERVRREGIDWPEDVGNPKAEIKTVFSVFISESVPQSI
jgi:hypothetical protein